MSWSALGCKIQLLVEIAVVELSGPTHTDQASAHDCIDVFRSMGLSQNLLIGLKLTLMLQISREALDRHVGDREQVRKRNPVA